MARWVDKVRGTLHPESMPNPELIDHLPLFISDVVDALRGAGSIEESAHAADHGVQRLGLGFNLDTVVREYGVLRDCILEVAREARLAVTVGEYQILFDCVITGISEAVCEYARQREAEMHRQATEHFAFIAHELRNPLSSSVLALNVLGAKGTLPEGDRSVVVLQRGLARMHELIEHSLRLARGGSGVDLRRAPIGLKLLLEDAETGASVDAEAKNVRLEVTVENDQEIHVDARLVRSALSNVVRNAVKFTHAGGSVEVRARIASGRAVIEVEDTCGGLPPGQVEAAFSPFVQLGTDTSGFGLGLAITKQAVDAHGGSMRVQNLPGKGCIFVLEIPCAMP